MLSYTVVIIFLFFVFHIHVQCIQKVNFGVAVERDESPSIEVLHDLQKKGLLLSDFKYCLERIGCQGALNEFLPASKTCACCFTLFVSPCLLLSSFLLHLLVTCIYM